MPKTDTISDHVDVKYIESKDCVNRKFAVDTRISLTCDLWTSPNGKQINSWCHGALNNQWLDFKWFIDWSSRIRGRSFRWKLWKATFGNFLIIIRSNRNRPPLTRIPGGAGLAFIIGSLGGWDPQNESVLKKLKIGCRYALTMRKLMESECD